ncbi:hypothetical protein DFH08DRAFT_841578 [Mycena albidolilacea]|uniref:Uncharacterized protein n=1 Tax=Mycena albidolilacea TaxID=1033008 RepID=A0AAD7F0S5_9AGAR|nr:hypothetical protein DFH08DRAFT_841578 [Mycena albidolilacea]
MRARTGWLLTCATTTKGFATTRLGVFGIEAVRLNPLYPSAGICAFPQNNSNSSSGAISSLKRPPRLNSVWTRQNPAY